MNKKLSINVPYKILSVFGSNPIKDNGKQEVVYHCPECINRKGSPDTKGKLYVNTKTYKFICFRCGYSGQIGRHVKVDERKVYEDDYDNDLIELIGDCNTIIKGEEDKFTLKIPIDKVTSSKTATEYLLSRGFTYEQMEYYDLRVGNIDNEFGRIVIPNEVKRHVYTDFYSARSYIGQTPKYHNPTKKKESIVFNLHRVKEGEPIILVEGALTAIAAGYHAVATLGKVLSRSQATQIVSKHPSVIYVNYDYNTLRESNDACRLLRSLSPEVKILNVIMKDDRDAADMSREEYVKCLESAVLYEPPIYKDILELINDI